jgi:hypothetical protein
VTDDIDWPARQGEEAIRQLDMLRVTLEAQIERSLDDAETAVSHAGERFFEGAVAAYRNVLALLGPEPAWTTDEDGEPF